MLNKLKTLMFLLVPATVFAAPDVDFSTFSQNGQSLTDSTGNAVIQLGKTTKICDTPIGIKSLRFDGTPDSEAKLDLSKLASKLDGMEFGISYWVKFDEIARKLENNDTGLFLMADAIPGDSWFRFRVKEFSPSNKKEFWGSINIGQWHYISFRHSYDKKETGFFAQSFEQVQKETRSFPLTVQFGSIGKIKGEIAGLRIWTTSAPTSDELLTLNNSSALLAEYTRKLESEKFEFSGGNVWKEALLKTLDDAKKKDKLTIPEILDYAQMINQADKVRQMDGNDTLTVLAGKPMSSKIRNPGAIPADAVRSRELYAAAAKGEFEPLTFFVFPFREVKKFEFTISDLKNKDGAVIPADAIDAKIVKSWYQASWESYFNSSNQKLMPDLLLNDDELVRVDEVRKKNYLRLNYPEGTKYEDVNYFAQIPDPFSTPKFNPFLEPVMDAPKLLPVKLDPIRFRQFFLTVHVPEKAEAGLYKGTISLKCDGSDAGTITVNLRVYPFTLPVACKQYDPYAEYQTYLIGSDTLDKYCQFVGDIDYAEEMLEKDFINMRDHNVRMPGMTWADDPSRFSMMLRTVKLGLKVGLPMKPLIGIHSKGDWGLNMEAASKPFQQVWTKDVVAKSGDVFEEKLKNIFSELEKLVGHREFYLYGFDEATSEEAFLFMSYYFDRVQKYGARSYTSGWGSNYHKLPSHETHHSEAAQINLDLAYQWHAIGGEISAYAAPFASPDNPDLMRRTQGLQMYRCDYDGFYILSYFEGIHLWNENINGTYRNFTFAYPTRNGPVNSISFEGIREGLDDIRYATLLRRLCLEAEKSGNEAAIMEAKKAMSGFYAMDCKNCDLDSARNYLADSIIRMQNVLKGGR